MPVLSLSMSILGFFMYINKLAIFKKCGFCALEKKIPPRAYLSG